MRTALLCAWNSTLVYYSANHYNAYLSSLFYLIDGTTVENKGKLILTEIFPSVQKYDI